MQPQDRVSPRGLFMHVLPRMPHGRSSGSVKLHSWVTTLGQQGTEPDLRVYAVPHRCEVVVLAFAALGEGSISRPFCLDVLVSVQRVQRADERTRTADLLITSDHSGVAGGCRGLQIPLSQGFSFLCFALGCTVLRSRWYQNGINITRGFGHPFRPYQPFQFDGAR